MPIVATSIERTFAVEATVPGCTNLSDEQVLEIRRLVDENQVVIIRNQDLSKEEQVHFSSRFGDLRHVGHNPDGGLLGVFNSRDNSNLFYRKDDTYQAASQFWHCASSTKEAQHYTFLHAKVAPEKGGGTWFLNTRLAYEDLDSGLQDYLKDKMACHSASHVYEFLWQKGFCRCGSMSESETNGIIALRTFTSPPVYHPVVISNPTGTKALYVNPLTTSQIEGMAEQESHELLAKLYEHCQQDRYSYAHQWRQGDLLIWDQFSTIHRGIPSDPGALRVLHKTSTFSLVSELSYYKTKEEDDTYERMKRTYRW